MITTKHKRSLFAAALLAGFLTEGATAMADGERRIVPRLGSGRLTPLAPREERADTYRIGDENGKHMVTQTELDQNAVLARAAKATAKLGGGTSFYLGKFNGKHVLATNHHVCPSQSACLGQTARFTLLGLNLKVVEYYGHWTDIDLALMAVQATPEQEAKLARVAGNFDFDAVFRPGQELVTVGYGVANNPGGALVANYDKDCKVFASDFRFMADPDALNPGDYEAWSFANGCDVSHGDSGSAMVDRETGHVVGIIWTGKIPKSPRVQSSSYLAQLLSSGGADIWTELSYAVPAPKIGEYLRNLVDRGTTVPQSTKNTLRAVLGE